MKVREPVARPLDVVAAELLLSASQAFLAGVLFYLAIGVWDDRGVGFGPVAIVVAALGLAVGGGWLYWLLGGVGWPLAAANVPIALLLGFAVVFGWRGAAEVFRVEGVPLLLSLAASVYGLICGVFLDSPRRLRWDQRARPRPGTSVPRLSPTTQRLAAQVPRSRPRRRGVRPADLPTPRPEPDGPQGADVAPAARPVGEAERELDEPAEESPVEAQATATDGAVTSAPTSAAESEAASALGSLMPTERLEKMAAADSASAPASGPEPAVAEPGAIELPTSIEPKPQKSPWAWAAPPEWNRDEDDEPPRRRSSRRS